MSNYNHETRGEELREAFTEFRDHRGPEAAHKYATAILAAYRAGILDDYDCGSKLGDVADWLCHTSEKWPAASA